MKRKQGATVTLVEYPHMSLQDYIDDYKEGERGVFNAKAESLIDSMLAAGDDDREIKFALQDIDGGCFMDYWVFHYIGETNCFPESAGKHGRDGEGNWIGEDGFTVNAPTEQDAWQEFLGSCSVNEDDYTCDLVK